MACLMEHGVEQYIVDDTEPTLEVQPVDPNNVTPAEQQQAVDLDRRVREHIREKAKALGIVRKCVGGSLKMKVLGRIQDVGGDETSPQLWMETLQSLFVSGEMGDKFGVFMDMLESKLQLCVSVDEYLDQCIKHRLQCVQAGWRCEDGIYTMIAVNGLDEAHHNLKMSLMAKENLTFEQFEKALKRHTRMNRTNEAGLRAQAMANAKDIGDKSWKMKIKCWKCSKRGHFSRECTDVANIAGDDIEDNVPIKSDNFYVDLSLKACDEGMKNSKVWVGDSGATKHMTYQSNWFKNMRPMNGNVIIGDGKRVPVRGIGEIIIKDKMTQRLCTLHDVLYVPDLECNLFSVGKCQQQGHTIIFPGSASGHMFVKAKDGARVCTGERRNGLFFMSFEVYKKSGRFLTNQNADQTDGANETALLMKGAAASTEIWHMRLGHVTGRKLRTMKTMININGGKMDGPCFGCARGKMTRRRRKKKRTRCATRCLERIHSDVIGPFPEGVHGYKYVLTFVDEASRYGRVFFMKKKSEALQHFKRYRAWAENHAQEQLKSMEMSKSMRKMLLQFKTDGGGEFCGREFENYLADNGIEHRVTNADEPRQNGLSERYGRTLQEMANAMLKHSRLANHLWPYSYKTAGRVLNVLPHSAIGASPMERWSGEKPDISYLRTFGCDAWVRVPHPSKGKDKAVLCTFVGYQDGLKGYLFLNKATGCVVKSGDAMFYEGNWNVSGVQRIKDSKGGEILWTKVEEVSGNAIVRLDAKNPEEKGPDEGIIDALDDEDENDDDKTFHDCYEYVDDRASDGSTDSVVEGDDADDNGSADSVAEESDDGGSADSVAEESDDASNDIGRSHRSSVNYELDYSDMCLGVEAALKCVDVDFSNHDGDTRIPRTLAEAMASPEKKEWKEAMAAEMKSMKENQVWHTATKKPRGKKKCVSSK